MSALLRSDIEVHGDYNPKIFHQKFVLRDYRGRARATSALLTGSANFTVTDTHRNLNHVFVFHDAYVCRQYLDEVEQLRVGSFGRGLHGPVPTTYDLGGVPVKVLFAPDHTPELEFMKQMLKVRPKGEIWFAIFTFAGSSGIDDTMLALARGGVTDPRRPRRRPGSPGLGRAEVAAAPEHRAARAEEGRQPGRAAEGPSQADGDRRPHRGRRQLQLHRAGQRVQRREPVRPRLSARGGRRRARSKSTPCATSPCTHAPRSSACSRSASRSCRADLTAATREGESPGRPSRCRPGR